MGQANFLSPVAICRDFVYIYTMSLTSGMTGAEQRKVKNTVLHVIIKSGAGKK
jgi:hypothetical protein